MRSDFRPYFEDAERELQSPAAGIAREIVSSAEERLEAQRGVRLRPDARYFLVLNLSEMIINPVQAVDGPSGIERTLDPLEEDVRTIVDTAADEATVDEDSDRPEVSGHSVVTALSDVWGKLRDPLDWE